MIINLEQDFLRYESNGATAYYGYADPGTQTSEKKWAIRQVIGTGPSLEVKWNLNDYFQYTSIWDNKADHFTTPATASIGFTHSVGTKIYSIPTGPTTSQNVNDATISMTWSEVAGVDKYRLNITDHYGVLYNELSIPFVSYHRRGNDRYTAELLTTRYTFKGKTSMTYSVSITSINQAGQSTQVYTYTT